MRNLLVGALLACAAATATAQVPEPKGYIGAGYGLSSYNDFCEQAGGFGCDDDGQAWRVQAGYMFVPWIGLEASFTSFGEARATGFLVNPPPGTTPLPSDGEGRTYAYALSALLRAPLGPMGLHAKLGYAAVTAKFNSTAGVVDSMGNVTFFSAEARESKGQFFYGAGATYDFARQWQVRFDWDRTKAQDNINDKYEVDAFTLGVGYRF
jgi:opacity protein-like surface antigen